VAGSYYLMSACQTADEFVAAFRRYAEKSLLFVPTQTPLTNGMRARIAVTLSDGSVMIEGDGEIVGATTRAVGLHARAGMSVRFISLDDTSRQVLDSLVKARLTSRPVPLPTHLRPRPRAGTVPEPSPELQAERRAQSTQTGMPAMPKVNAEALPAECVLVEVPEGGEPPTKAPAVDQRFDYSAPLPKESVEVHAESTMRGTVPPRAPTLKGPAPGKLPAAPISKEITAVSAPPTFESGSFEIVEVSDDSLPAVAAVPPSTIGTPAPAPASAAPATETVPDAPPAPLVPAPPKLPPSVAGRQSMSKTMLGVAPVVLKAPAPAASPAPDASGATPASPRAGGEEVLASWWPDHHPPFDGGETQPMEPMFAETSEPAREGMGPFPAGKMPPLTPPPRDTELSAPPLAMPLPARDPETPPPGAFPQPAYADVLPPARGDSTDMIGLTRRRPSKVMLASIGGAVLLAVIVIVIATGGGKSSGTDQSKPVAQPAAVIDAGAIATANPPALPTTNPTPAISADAATSAIAPTPTPTPTPTPGPPPTGGCKASFSSTPPGTEVVIAGKVAGSTPLQLELPCHATTATFRRTRYQSKDVSFTPTSDGASVSAKLERPSFTVKIYSTPPGASVTIAGKPAGKTPLTTKAPGFEAVNVVFKKDGYASATAKLYAKSNGTSVKATLRRGGAPSPAPKTKSAPKHR